MDLLDSDTNLDLANDGASDAVSQPSMPSAPETVSGTVREAYDRAKEVAEANGDPEKLEEIRVRRAKDGRFERGEGNDTRSATGERTTAPKAGKEPASEKTAPTVELDIPKTAEERAAATAPLSLRPPPGWSAQARADYAKLPPHIQQAVAQREVEVNKGFERLKDYSGLETHLQRIKSSNLTPAQFVDNAVKWEDSLKSNPEHTVMQAIKLGGLDPLRLSAKILQQAGYQIGPRTGQPQRQAAAQPPVNVNQAVQQALAQREQAAATQKATSEAEAFLTDPKNVHAEAVVDEMVALIKAGRAKDFASAYDMACWARPDIRAELIKQQRQPSNGNPRRALDQARLAARATTGAPNGNRPPLAAPGNPKTVHDAVRMAFAKQQDAD